MRRSLAPSLNALIAFDSVVRHGGILRASDELNLSQSAVSRLVKTVEDALQIRLFDRVRQRLVLIDAGSAYATDVRKILNDVEHATQRVMAYGSGEAGGVLNLGVSSTFAAKWLIPRLKRVASILPHILLLY